MRSSVSAATVAALLLAGLAGCQRSDDGAPAPAATGAAPATGAGSAEAPAATPDEPTAAAGEPLPEGVLHAYVWECDGGTTLHVKNLYREHAITLEMHEGPRRLPLVVSASGAKYSDGSLTFWTKGQAATLEREGESPVECREVRAQSLLADARERGVVYRGIGNEPGWTLEIGPGERMVFVTNYGGERHAFAIAATGDGAGSGAIVYRGEGGADGIEVTVSAEACADDMSGEAFDHRMAVTFGDREYRGCAVELQ